MQVRQLFDQDTFGESRPVFAPDARLIPAISRMSEAQSTCLRGIAQSVLHRNSAVRGRERCNHWNLGAVRVVGDDYGWRGEHRQEIPW